MNLCLLIVALCNAHTHGYDGNDDTAYSLQLSLIWCNDTVTLLGAFTVVSNRQKIYLGRLSLFKIAAEMWTTLAFLSQLFLLTSIDCTPCSLPRNSVNYSFKLLNDVMWYISGGCVAWTTYHFSTGMWTLHLTGSPHLWIIHKHSKYHTISLWQTEEERYSYFPFDSWPFHRPVFSFVPFASV